MTLEKQFVGKAAPLHALLLDPQVTDVLVNGVQSLYVERNGALELGVNPFTDRGDVTDWIERLVAPLGRRIEAAHPYLDGRLADGSRFHVILPPIALEGPIVSIRKPRPLCEIPLESFADRALVDWVAQEIDRGRNLLISGSTGSGKTTLLSLLLGQVAAKQRVIVLEESAEIQLPDHPHLLHLEARPASPDGTGEVTLKDLLRNALRMRPDRLVLGECRGAEALDLLQAMNTGHLGSLSTVHANGALDALRRVEALALSAPGAPPFRVVREWVATSIHGVVHLGREQRARRIQEVILVQGLEGENYRIAPKFRSVPRLSVI